MIWPCHEKGRRIFGKKSDEDGCGGKEMERKTGADGQCKCGLEREGGREGESEGAREGEGTVGK